MAKVRTGWKLMESPQRYYHKPVCACVCMGVIPLGALVSLHSPNTRSCANFNCPDVWPAIP